MSREIKFRAWHHKLNQMYEVVAINLDLHFVHLDPDYCHKVKFKDIELMQYTGLKDKNGKEINEGDLIQYGEIVYEVRYNFSRWIMLDKEFDGYDNFGAPLVGPSFSRNKMKDIEIIGNIYENPEMVKSND